MPRRRLLLHLTAAATASGVGDYIQRQRRLQGKAERASRESMERRRAGRESRERQRVGSRVVEQRRAGSRVVAAASLALSLSLSSIFIGGGWLGLRAGCSWAS
jgi:hypothetical protein